METGTRSKHGFSIEHILAKPDKMQPLAQNTIYTTAASSILCSPFEAIGQQQQQHHDGTPESRSPTDYASQHPSAFESEASDGNISRNIYLETELHINRSPMLTMSRHHGTTCTTPDSSSSGMDTCTDDTAANSGCTSDDCCDGASEEGDDCKYYYYVASIMFAFTLNLVLF